MRVFGFLRGVRQMCFAHLPDTTTTPREPDIIVSHIRGEVVVRMIMMDIKELSQAMDEFVRTKGWYQPDSPRQQTARNIAISLSLEAAEILEHFQWFESARSPEELGSEMADVTLYLLQLANITGIDLEKAVLAKLKTNYTRTWDKPE